ncbi:MAG: F0F1 ATP synthase subunit B [Bacteroidetes bacterium]|nr:F0F1 ATP synthase subunit B [Bacteroidota bacterium]
MMDLHPGLMIWTMISFVIFFLMLRKIAWGPIVKALEAREKGIKDNIEAAEAARNEAEKSLVLYKKQLAEAQAESQKVVAKARQDAERIGEELKAKAKLDAQAEVERARKQIGLERDEAVSSIRTEIASLVVESARRVIGKTLDSDDHKRLIAESIKESSN